MTPLSVAFFALLAWMGLGLVGSIMVRLSGKPLPFLFSLSILPGLAVVVSGLWALSGSSVYSRTLPFGLPGLSLRLAQDPLSSFFLAVLGFVSIPVLLFSTGFFRETPPEKAGWLLLWIPVFLGTMGGVLLAADVFTFLLFWEGMALASFFLVLTDMEEGWVRNAGFLYLLMAHIGTGLILLSFILLSTGQNGPGLSSLSFEDITHAILPRWVPWSVFLLSLAGFGAKAGIVPLHIWLPEAHPAAPAPVSALMSGLMLKIAIYGLMRVDLGLLGIRHIVPGMGAIVMIIGSLSALFGVLHALMQHEPKRLLAYHSIENIGIILIGFGLFLLFWTTGHFVPATVAFAASLFHVLNHALFKSLLFLGAGSVVQKTGLHDLNALGGLIKNMPFTSIFFLIGALSISGLPPLNGFISEWLTFQSALWSTSLQQSFLQSVVVLSAALLALAGALTAMCFVKVVGVSFLGNARSPQAESAREAGLPEKTGMGILSLACIAAGLLPFLVFRLLDPVVFSLTGDALPMPIQNNPWLWFSPISLRQAQYSPLLIVFFLSLVLGILFLATRRAYSHARVAPTWNCGYPARRPRMQDTADAFGQPVRRFFAPFFRMERTIPVPGDTRPEYHLKVRDPFWSNLYGPLLQMVVLISEKAEKIRNRRISQYLLYSFVTLSLLLLYFEERS
ncbi:MAG: hydrogenase 4 subunit B [Leptospirillum sp.]